MKSEHSLSGTRAALVALTLRSCADTSLKSQICMIPAAVAAGTCWVCKSSIDTSGSWTPHQLHTRRRQPRADLHHPRLLQTTALCHTNHAEKSCRRCGRGTMCSECRILAARADLDAPTLTRVVCVKHECNLNLRQVSSSIHC